jgi:hypothetical protein
MSIKWILKLIGMSAKQPLTVVLLQLYETQNNLTLRGSREVHCAINIAQKLQWVQTKAVGTIHNGKRICARATCRFKRKPKHYKRYISRE